MEERKGLTLVGLIVTIFIILFLLALIMPRLGKVPKIEQRVICGTNLKGLGTAMTVYANDYKDNYPQLPGTGPWSKRLGFDYDLQKPDFSKEGAEGRVSRTISASWYLLVKYADADTKSFICPAQKNITDFKKTIPNTRDIKDFWDFGSESIKHISFVMHNPYGQYPADDRRSSAFAVAADMNPYIENGDFIINPKETVLQTRTNFYMPFDKHLYNSIYHGTEGQNVLYADGHNSWETRPDVGVRNDNIYTFWSAKPVNDPNELYRRVGQPPAGRSPENDAKSLDDSFLAI